jgi:hypothetical protein
MVKFFIILYKFYEIYNKCHYIANIANIYKSQKERKVWLGMYAHIVQEIHEWQQQQHKAGVESAVSFFIE